MDTWTSSESQRATFLRKIVQADDQKFENNFDDSDIVDITTNDIKEETPHESSSSSRQPKHVKNLCYELPTKHVLPKKRKSVFSVIEQKAEKCMKMDKEANKNNESSDDEVEKVFNYMTGLYEPVKKTVNTRSTENNKIFENTPVEEKCVLTDPAISTAECVITLPESDPSEESNHLEELALQNENLAQSQLNRSEENRHPDRLILQSKHVRSSDSSEESIPLESPILQNENARLSESNPFIEVGQVDSPEQQSNVSLSDANDNEENEHLDIIPLQHGAISFDRTCEKKTFDSSILTSISLPPRIVSPLEFHSALNDDNSNHSNLSLNSPAQNMSDIDESSNHTVIHVPETTSVSQDTSSRSIVASSTNNKSSNDSVIDVSETTLLSQDTSSRSIAAPNNIVLKCLVVMLTPISKSSVTSSHSTSLLETATNKDNNASKNFNKEKDLVPKSSRSKAESSFIKKLRSRLSLTNWTCKTCGYKATTKDNLISHIYNVHLKEDYEIKMKCKSCSFECDTPTEMEQHKLGHKINASDGNATSASVVLSESGDVSDGDDNSPISDTTLEATAVANNNKNPEEIIQILESDNDMPSKTKTKHLQCFLCEYGASEELHLEDHTGKHKGEKYYCDEHFWTSACSTCSKCIFENMLNRNRSFLTCDTCNYRTSRAASFKEHSSKPSSCQSYMARKTNKKKRYETGTEQHKDNSVENTSFPQNSVQADMDVTVFQTPVQNTSNIDRNQISESSGQLPQSPLLSEVSGSCKDSSLVTVCNTLPDSTFLKNGCDISDNQATQKFGDIRGGMLENSQNPNAGTVEDFVNNTDSSLITPVSEKSESHLAEESSVGNSVENKEEQKNKNCLENLNSILQSIESFTRHIEDEDSPTVIQNTNEIASAKDIANTNSMAVQQDLLIDEVFENHITKEVNVENCVSKLMDCTEGGMELQDKNSQNAVDPTSTAKLIVNSGGGNGTAVQDFLECSTNGVDESAQKFASVAVVVENQLENDLNKPVNNEELLPESMECSTNDILDKNAQKLTSVAEVVENRLENDLNKPVNNEKLLPESMEGLNNDILDKNAQKLTSVAVVVENRLENDLNKPVNNEKLLPESMECSTNDILDKNAQKLTSVAEVVENRLENDLNKPVNNEKLLPESMECSTNDILDKNAQKLTSVAVVVENRLENDLNKPVNNEKLLPESMECSNNDILDKNAQKLTSVAVVVENRLENDLNKPVNNEKLLPESMECSNNDILDKNAQKLTSVAVVVENRLENDLNKPVNNEKLLPESMECSNNDILDKNAQKLTSVAVVVENRLENDLNKPVNNEKLLPESMECSNNDILDKNAQKLTSVAVVVENQLESHIPFINDIVHANFQNTKEPISIARPIENSAAEVLLVDKISETHATKEINVESSGQNMESSSIKIQDKESQNVKESSSLANLIEKSVPDMENGGQSATSFADSNRHPVKTSNTSKKRKKSLELEYDGLDSHNSDSSAEEDFPITFKCFDCDISISKKDELKAHALSCHSNSSFKCNLHDSKSNFYECSKCVYELIFITRTAQFKINDPFKVALNKTSSFSTGKYWQQLAEYKEPKSYQKCIDTDSDSNDDLFDIEPTAIRITRAKSKVLTKNNQQSSQLMSLARCFDCDYVTADKYNVFLLHVFSHIGSKYQCIEHHRFKQKDCLKCQYERALKSGQKVVHACKGCGYRTSVRFRLRRHTNNTGACSNWLQRNLKSGEFRCLQCHYRTSYEIFLKYHMVDHLDLTLSCDIHRTRANSKCLLCLNVKYLEQAKKEVMGCDKCNFKTVIKQVIDLHDCEAPVLNENDETNSETTDNHKVPKNASEGENKVKCFDCKSSHDTDYEFKRHILRHLGSKYQCMEHRITKVGSCPKCRYEETLQNVLKVAKICKCGFKTLDKERFNKHQETLDSCNDWRRIARRPGTEEIMCFSCGYATIYRKFLKYHMVDHLDVSFSCGLHPQNKNEKCEKCINEECLSNAKKEAKTCGKCNFKSAIKQIFNSHICINVNSKKDDDLQEAFQCFDCKFACGEKKLFREHVTRHIGSKYECIQHKIECIECHKCYYEKTLKVVQAKAKSCTECGYTTIRASLLLRHKKRTNKCEIWRNRAVRVGEIRCLLCQYSTGYKKFLMYHMVDHLDRTLSCNQHRDAENEKCATCLNVQSLEGARKEVKTCDKCNFKTLIKQVFNMHTCIGIRDPEQSTAEIDDDINSKNASNITQDSKTRKEDDSALKSRINAKCFDCKYSSDNEISFKEHLCSHIGSKYQCVEHWNSKVKDCLKCHYEEVLRELQKEISTCKICEYKAPNQLYLSRHLKDFGSCSKWAHRILQPNEVRCLQCQYVTKHKKFLTYHMVDHLDLTLSCDEHCENKNEKCEKCINAECLENAKKEVETCKKCNLKTVIKQIFEIHDCEGKAKNNPMVDGQEDASKKASGTKDATIETNERLLEATDTGYISLKTDFQKQEVSDVKETKARVKCFDCKYSCTDKDLTFKSHICRHIGSKYQCMEHLTLKSTECPRCYYEVTLGSIPEEIVKCSTCGFITIDKNEMTKHKDGSNFCKEWVNRSLQPNEVRCLQCQYVTGHRKFLKYHMVDHLDVIFSCNEHREDKNNKCEKCINEKCLDSAKKDAKMCEKCCFKTAIKQIFDVHDCEGKMTNGSKAIKQKDAPSEAVKSKDVVTDSTETTKTLLKKIDTSLENTSTNNEKVGVEAGTLKIQDTISLKDTQIKVKCFDCKYSCKDKDVRFKKHICRHIGSKYQCMEHLKSKLMECLKCYYEVALNNLREEILKCSTCGFITIDKNKMTKHKDGNDSCKEWVNRSLQPTELRCFQCQYVTAHRKFLKYHMVDHLDVIFSCNEHQDEKNEKCEKCINEKCLDNAKKDVKICERCCFKTAIKQIFDVHDCEGKMTITSKAIQQEDASSEAVRSEEVVSNSTKTTRTSLKISDISSENTGTGNLNNDNGKVDVEAGSSIKEDTNNIHITALKVKCFDCKYVCKDKDSAFKTHICQHVGSKYQCMEHLKSKLMECPKCYYEVTLNNLREEVIKCSTCGYITIDEQEMTKHKDGNDSCKEWINRNLRPHELRCLQCQYVTTHRKFLMYHMVDHLNSPFFCEEHQENKEDKCEKCLNQTCFEYAKKEVKSCKKCSFKTAIKQIFDVHECDAEMTINPEWISQEDASRVCESDNVIGKDTEATRHLVEIDDAPSEGINPSAQTNNTREVNVASSEAVETDVTDNTAEAIGHSSGSANTNNKSNNTGNVIVTTSSQNQQEINNDDDNDQETKIQGKCFDCKYSCTVTPFRFRAHICRHIGSKFQCMEHPKDKIMDCLKCYYEVTLGKIPEMVKRCSTCGYITTDNFRMAGHKNGKDMCKRWLKRKLKADELRCLQCPYVTAHKKFLNYHMVDHLDTEFVCKKHLKNKHKSCLKCIHEESLLKAKRDVIICDKCNFKTVVRKVFDIHECMVQRSSSITIEEGNDERGVVDSLKDYTCFDCNEFIAYTTDELAEHAIIHCPSTFQCNEHSSENSLDHCPKCIYKNIAEKAKASIIVCEICTFKTCSEYSFNCHDCINDDNTNGLKEGEEQDGASTANMFVCYHCDYRSNIRVRLRNHAVRHWGESFKCDDHNEIKEFDCKKCIYEQILKSFDTTLKVCINCQFRTLSELDFDSHVTNNSCSSGQPQTSVTMENSLYFFKCFDCGATYQNEAPLKMHAVRHIGSSFQCKEHDRMEGNCSKCTYESIVQNTEANTFTCTQCGYKSYTWFHLRSHQRNSVNCQVHKAKLLAEGKPLNISQGRDTFRCFDCEFSHQRKDFLVQHIVVHKNSSFQCDQHQEHSEDCPKCLYRELLNKIPRKSQCYDCTPPLVFAARYALKRHIFRKHRNSLYVCKRHSVKSEKCSQCLYAFLVKATSRADAIVCGDCKTLFDTKENLKIHIKSKHLGSEFVCDIHQSFKNSASCNKCFYAELVLICEREVSFLRPDVISTSQEVIENCQCFDCDFKPCRREVLLRHVHANHIDSNFSCINHTLGEIDATSCRMCLYESILVSCKQSIVQKCTKCSFEAPNMDALHKHYEHNHSEATSTKNSAVASKDFRRNKSKYPCLGCNSFGANTQDKLFRHLNRKTHDKFSIDKFTCGKHLSMYDKDCEECVFAKVSAKVREHRDKKKS